MKLLLAVICCCYSLNLLSCIVTGSVIPAPTHALAPGTAVVTAFSDQSIARNYNRVYVPTTTGVVVGLPVPVPVPPPVPPPVPVPVPPPVPTYGYTYYPAVYPTTTTYKYAAYPYGYYPTYNFGGYRTVYYK